MKKIIKKVLSKNFMSKYKFAINKVFKKKHGAPSFSDKIKTILFNVRKIHIIDFYQFSEINKYIKEEVASSDFFTYLIDFNCFVRNYSNFNHNMTPDYEFILRNSLEDIRKYYEKNEKQLLFIDELEKYLNFYILKVKQSNFKGKENTIKYLENIKNKECESFIEALQRILFFNQIFWQMGYSLCGLGRLDYILDKYYQDDIKNNKINKEEAEKIIIDFYKILNSYFEEKSSCLNGDTGQIIIIGGEDENGNNFSNDLTYIFIDALQKYNKPDPKLFLRVNSNTDEGLLAKAIECMASGIGSPLLSNDDIIIPKLKEFGYDEKDARNYVTAACWEPSPCGDSIDFNNIAVLNFLIPFNEIFKDDDLKLTMDEIKNKCFEKFKEYIEKELENLSTLQYDGQPYLSLFIKSCRESGTIISDETPKYKNLGVTTLGISNVVNSILNIKNIVFEKKLLTLNELNFARKENFKDEKILEILKNNKDGYGSRNQEAIDLTNEIAEFISKEFEKYNTYYGGKFKLGLSAPSYVENGKTTEASFDGRKNAESLNVHISSSANTYIDIMEFATNIKYMKNMINGNVVDYVLSPNYIKTNLDKFTKYIKAYINKGMYQLQINVIDSKTLKDAKNNPELYKNLIVRVWGFSAYFNDLPEEYKELLIRRAEDAERLYN